MFGSGKHSIKSASGLNVHCSFPCGLAGKEYACNAGDLGSIPERGRSPWIREWQPTPEFWPREFWPRECHGLYSPWVRKELDTTERLLLTYIYIYIYIYMESRRIILMNLSSGKEWKYRHREQTYGHRGGRRGWDKLRK